MSSAILMNALFDNIKTIITSLEVKKEYLADNFETLDTAKEYDKYYMAMLSTNDFSFYHYDVEFIQKVLPHIEYSVLEGYAKDNLSIPDSFRPLLLSKMRQYLIDAYDEPNAYYRPLLGLPDIGETGYIHNGTPIHLLEDSVIQILRNNGTLDSIIKNNPENRYIYFIKNKLNALQIHEASAFSILFFEESKDPNVNALFYKLYEECRIYIISQFYNEDLSYQSEEYYGFIGMSIIFMTINRLISEYYKTLARNDFYDRTLIRLLFKSYGVKYYENIPLKYQRMLIKNLNLLLRNSGIDKIYVLIHDIFGFKNVNMFKYYLSKSQRFDSNGNPLYHVKEIDTEFGKETVPDLNANNELYFIKVPVETDKFSSEISDTSNIVSYDTVVHDDPYWGNGFTKDDFRNKLLETDFSMKETKYVGMDARYRVDLMNFEINYFIQMVNDLKDIISGIYVNLSNITQSKINLFESIVLLSHLLCKKFNFDGNIRKTHTVNLSVIYGFNFKEDLNYINSLIPDDFKYKFQIPVNNMTADSLSDLFTNNKNFYYYLSDRMYTTKDKREYDILKKLYTITCTKYDNDSCYAIDGEVPESYLKYLEKSNPSIYSYVITITDDEVNDVIEYMCNTLDDLFDNANIEYIFSNLPNVTADSIKLYMRKITNFFMSYKADFRFFMSSYVISDKLLNTIKLLDTCDVVGSNLVTSDMEDLSLSDTITGIKSIISEYSDLGIKLEKDILAWVNHILILKITDGLNIAESNNEYSDNVGIRLDIIDNIIGLLNKKSKITFNEKEMQTVTNEINQIIDIRSIPLLISYFTFKEYIGDLGIDDLVHYIKSLYECNEHMVFNESLEMSEVKVCRLLDLLINCENIMTSMHTISEFVNEFGVNDIIKAFRASYESLDEIILYDDAIFKFNLVLKSDIDMLDEVDRVIMTRFTEDFSEITFRDFTKITKSLLSFDYKINLYDNIVTSSNLIDENNIKLSTTVNIITQ